MKKLSARDRDILELLVSSNQNKTKAIISHYVKRHYKNIIDTPQYIIAIGDIPIALVAHMDTVFEKNMLLDTNKDMFYDEQRNVAFCPDGAGFDDKAGIFAILKIISAGLRPHLIFTTDEEVGGKGAMEVAELPCPFKELKYIIELDRRGSNDCVFYDCDNQSFIDYVETFGFEWNFGSYSDICEFCPSWEVAGVNLSIGYQDEHSVSEILHVGQMYATIAKVKQMLSNVTSAPFFKYIPAKNTWNTLDYTNWYKIGEGIYSRSSIDKCAHCGKYHMEEELIPAVMLDGSTGFYCFNCLEFISWCGECDSAYQTPKNDDGICNKCKQLKENKYNVAIGNNK